MITNDYPPVNNFTFQQRKLILIFPQNKIILFLIIEYYPTLFYIQVAKMKKVIL